LLSFKEYVLVDLPDGNVKYEWLWLNGERFFENFAMFIKDIAEEENMSILMKNSIIQYLVCLLIGMPLNIIFAYIIYKKIPASGFFQVILYLPQMVSSVVVSMMFSKFLGETFPNLCKYMFGIEGVPKDLLTHPDTAFTVNLFYIVWVGFGSQLILYSGAMSRIPDSLIEFGELEGINLMKEFWYVVVPMVYITITVFLVTGIAGIFTSQLALYNFYAGSAPLEAKTLGYHFYVMVIGQGAQTMQDYPYASAAGVMFTIIVAPITLVGRHLLEKYGPTVEF
jgi:ABC-type sugar transport system permease subunit